MQLCVTNASAWSRRLVLAAALLALAGLGRAAKPTVFLRGPSTFVGNTPFNVSITFSVPVTRFAPFQVRAFGACPVGRRWLAVDATGRRYVGQWRVQSFCPRVGEEPELTSEVGQIPARLSVTISVNADTVPEGNQFSNSLVITSAGPESIINSTIQAPKFYGSTDTALTAQVEFTRSAGFFQPSSLVVTGATVDARWRYDNCIRPSDRMAVEGPAPRTTQAGSGSCTLFIAYVRPTGTGPITITVPPNPTSSTFQIRGSTVTVPFSSVSARGKYNVTVLSRNGRNTFGASDAQVYVRFTFTGDQGALATGFDPSDVTILPSGSAVAAASWLFTPGSGRFPTVTDTYELAITPLRNAWFGVYVNENVVDAPGNNPAFQNVSYDASSGGGGLDRPANVAISGPFGFNSTTAPLTYTFAWAGVAAEVATFAQSSIRLVGAKPVAGSFKQLDVLTFSLTVLPTISGLGRDDRRINVWVVAGAVEDSFASRNYTSYFTQTLPRITTSIEAPSFFSFPVVRVYLLLSTPVPYDAVKPSDLVVRGGTIRSSDWIGVSSSRPPVGNIADFSTFVYANSDSNGGFASISVRLDSDVIRVANGNNAASAFGIGFAASTGVRPPACNLFAGAGEHSGPGDEFLVEVNCSQPVDGGRITSAFGSIIPVNARVNGFLGRPTFPALQFFVRVRPLDNADVTLILPQNAAGSPGNSRASVVVPYDPTSPGSPVITVITASRDFHEGPDVHPTFRVNINFGSPVPALGVLNVTDVVSVFNGFIPGAAWTFPPRNNTGFGSFAVATIEPKDIAIVIGANTVPGVNNLAASLVIPFKTPGLTATLTSASSHDGRCPFAVTTTFSDVVTGFSAAGLKAVPSGAVTFAPAVQGSGPGPYPATCLPNGVTSSVTVQVDQDVVTTPAQGNYESRSVSVRYSRPSWRAALQATMAGPAFHDGFTPIVVNVTWPQSVYGFQPADVSVTPGTADTAWLPATPDACTTYAVSITPGALSDMRVTLPTSALPAPGNLAAELIIPFRAVPTPTPRPTPSAQPTPSSRPTTACTGFRALNCNFGSCMPEDGGYCKCNQGYTGYSCDTRVPNSTATCFNGVKDGAEADVDCGGDLCGPCPAGFACAATADCTGADALCTKGKVCTPRLIDVPLSTGGFVVAARLQLVALPKASLTDDVQVVLREALASFIAAGTASGHRYTSNDILIRRVVTVTEAVALGLASARQLGAGALDAARAVTALPGAPGEALGTAAERLAAGASTTIDVQVNLQSPGDADNVAYWVNYAVGGNRLVTRLSQQLPGIHIASVQGVSPAAKAPAERVDLTPIDSKPAAGDKPAQAGIGNGAAAGIAVGCLVVGGLLGAGIMFSTGGCSGGRRPRKKDTTGGDTELTSTRPSVDARPVTNSSVVNPLDGIAGV